MEDSGIQLKVDGTKFNLEELLDIANGSPDIAPLFMDEEFIDAIRHSSKGDIFYSTEGHTIVRL